MVCACKDIQDVLTERLKMNMSPLTFVAVLGQGGQRRPDSGAHSTFQAAKLRPVCL